MSVATCPVIRRATSPGTPPLPERLQACAVGREASRAGGPTPSPSGGPSGRFHWTVSPCQPLAREIQVPWSPGDRSFSTALRGPVGQAPEVAVLGCGRSLLLRTIMSPFARSRSETPKPCNLAAAASGQGQEAQDAGVNGKSRTSPLPGRDQPMPKLAHLLPGQVRSLAVSVAGLGRLRPSSQTSHPCEAP